VSPAHQAAIEQARALWQEKRFFHWDLEFPEVFVDLERRDWAENPGFDAVIGNPPYDVLAEKERQEDLSYLLDFIGNRY
jgi:methylase of polypeptide subunit release factors